MESSSPPIPTQRFSNDLVGHLEAEWLQAISPQVNVEDWQVGFDEAAAEHAEIRARGEVAPSRRAQRLLCDDPSWR